MGKRIAVFTLQGLVNYGNRLQNFAVEYLLKNEGVNPQSIIVTNHPILKPIELIVKRLITRLLGTNTQKNEVERQALFNQFNRYINIRYYNIKNLYHINDEYDVVLVGSDQVWNPKFDTNHIFLLPFAKRRICLSPSFGTDSIPKGNIDLYRRELSCYQYLSVREKSGKRIIYDLTGREAEVLIDPTMAVDSSVWKKLERKPNGINTDKFVLSYTLGELSNQRNALIARVTNKYSYEHIAIFDNLKENKYLVGPREFLWLIHHAEIIITDSFHAAVFSILFQKPFITIKREGAPEAMYDRIRTLLGIFGLEICGEINIDIEEIMSIDYSNCNRQLDVERKRFNDYLRKALSE